MQRCEKLLQSAGSQIRKVIAPKVTLNSPLTYVITFKRALMIEITNKNKTYIY